MSEDIEAAILNAMERGATLQQAMQSMLNAGYNPREVQETARTLTQGAVSVIHPDNQQSQQPQEPHQLSPASSTVQQHPQSAIMPGNNSNPQQASQQPRLNPIVTPLPSRPPTHSNPFLSQAANQPNIVSLPVKNPSARALPQNQAYSSALAQKNYFPATAVSAPPSAKLPVPELFPLNPDEKKRKSKLVIFAILLLLLIILIVIGFLYKDSIINYFDSLLS